MTEVSYVADIYKSGDRLGITVPKTLHEIFKAGDKVQVKLEKVIEKKEEE